MSWKPVYGYEGLYEVSDKGEVVSLPRNYHYGTIYTRTPLRQREDKGYLRVVLYRNGERCCLPVHRLVAGAFIPNPDNLPCVNHKDENRQNNCVDNLMWCTHRQNTNWGTCRSKISKAVSKQVDQYTKDGTFVKRWQSMTEAAKALKIPISEISKCTRTTRYTSGGFHWRYVNERNQMA